MTNEQQWRKFSSATLRHSVGQKHHRSFIASPADKSKPRLIPHVTNIYELHSYLHLNLLYGWLKFLIQFSSFTCMLHASPLQELTC